VKVSRSYKQSGRVSTVDSYWPGQQVASACWNVTKLRTFPVVCTYIATYTTTPCTTYYSYI